MVRDFRVFFVSDATAAAPMGGMTEDQLQSATLATLGFLFAQVLSLNEVLAKLRDQMGSETKCS